ncbi:MAG: M20 family metallopeptidase, partial [Clostridiaceae bacterium]|nr:M20 family metallopeptidase [Clostridiaceae bacterium]
RVILGTNEENGMQDMKYYFTREPVPRLGFSPDARYPVINREKGILQLALVEKGFTGNENAKGEQGQGRKDFNNGCKGRHKNKGEPLAPFMEIIGGDAVNMVPAWSSACIQAGQLQPDEILHLQGLAGKAGGNGIEVLTVEGGDMCIRARGRSAHAASPENGINAIYRLLDFLGKVVCLDGLPGFIYRNKIGLDTTGQSLGINFKDEESGALTLNLGKIRCNQGEKRAALDIRYPVTCNYGSIVDILREKADKEDVGVEIIEHLPPLYMPENHPLIVKLGSAYEKITGKKAGLLSIGGGTYARTLKNNGVAFGGAGTGAHQPDEHVSIEELMRHARICTQAMYEIAT